MKDNLSSDPNNILNSRGASLSSSDSCKLSEEKVSVQQPINSQDINQKNEISQENKLKLSPHEDEKEKKETEKSNEWIDKSRQVKEENKRPEIVNIVNTVSRL